MIKRIIQDQIFARIGKGKAILLFGPRQTGKTTLLHQLLDGVEGVKWLNGDEPDVQQIVGYVANGRFYEIILYWEVV